MSPTAQELEAAALVSLKAVADAHPDLDHVALLDVLRRTSRQLVELENMGGSPVPERYRDRALWRAEGRLTRARREQERLPLCVGSDQCFKEPETEESLCCSCHDIYTKRHFGLYGLKRFTG